MTLRVGVLGVGDRGRAYARALADGAVPRARLAAVADVDPAALRAFSDVPHFGNDADLLAARSVDALVIATPPAVHADETLRALEAGLHVLAEKPLVSRPGDARRLLPAIERAQKLGRVVATAFPLRADARYVELGRLLEQHAVGRLARVAWTVTDCFRTDAYYRASPWRRTREGEGGGVLLNQALHQLDLWQRLFGMPVCVQGHCAFGRFHEIEVEDQVTAYFEHEGGMTGVFVASTGEPLGVNRLEIHGAGGRITLEGGELVLERTAASVSDSSPHARVTTPTEVERRTLPVGGLAVAGLLRDFADAALDGTPLLAPAADLRAIELAHAISLSHRERRPFELAATPVQRHVAQALEQIS